MLPENGEFGTEKPALGVLGVRLTRVQPLEGRPELSYPCDWTYRIVCSDEGELRRVIGELVGTARHTLKSLGESSGGRYRRVELVLAVRDEPHRNAVFVALTRTTGVRFVL
jgi:putative lipoic acid-binding regulatory protein